jgi:hydrogenase nickel incorporation protein HypA/HybF
MHELGIANSILEAVEAEARRHPGARVAKAGLRVGELAGVDADALRFCLGLLVRETPWESLAFEIEAVRQRRTCCPCGQAFVVEGYRPECPVCGSTETKFLAGDELELAYLEVET